MTVKELFSKPKREVLDYLRLNRNTKNLGLDHATTIYNSDLHKKFKIIKKTDAINEIYRRNFLIYARYDKYTYLRVEVAFYVDGIAVDISKRKYVSGEIIEKHQYDSQRIV
jgi:hypothetical protein